MDAHTLRLMSRLRWGPFDATALGRIREELELQRDVLATAGDREALVSLVEHLQGWSKSAREPALASVALFEAATVAETELEDFERAADLYVLSLEQDPANTQGLARAEPLLKKLGRHEQLETIIGALLQALGQLGEAEAPKLAQVFRVLARLRSEQNRDVSEVIQALEGALDAAPDISDLSALGELYETRAAPGDAQRAAHLYATLGDVLGDPEGLPMLEKALDQMPVHQQALELLEKLVPEAEHGARLKNRWTAYIAQAPAGPEADARRWSLVRAYRADGQLQEALDCLLPLVNKGDKAAAEVEVEIRAQLALQQSAAAQPSPDAAGGERRPPPLPGKRMSFKKTMLGHGAPVIPAVPVGGEAREPSRQSDSDRSASYPAPVFPPPDPEQQPAVQEAQQYRAPQANDEEAISAQRATADPALDARPQQPVHAHPEQSPEAGAAELAAAMYAQPHQAPAERPAAGVFEQPATEGFEQPGAPGVYSEPSPQAPEPALDPGVMPNAEVAGYDLDMGAAEASAFARPRPKGKLLIAGAAALAFGAAGAFALAMFTQQTPDGPATPSNAVEPAVAKEPPRPEAAKTETPKPSDKARETAGDVPKEAPKPSQQAGKAAKRAKRKRPGPSVSMVAKLVKYRGGKLDKGRFRKAVQGALPKMKKCYVRTLKRKPRLRGRITFTWSVNKRGRPFSVKRVRGTIKDKPLTRCVSQAIRATRYPKPRRRAAKVWVPFAFRKTG